VSEALSVKFPNLQRPFNHDVRIGKYLLVRSYDTRFELESFCSRRQHFDRARPCPRHTARSPRDGNIE
jgi:hypothetical protein